MLPTIKKAMKQAQEAFSKVDTKAMTNKLHQAVNFMKKKMQDLKKSSENNEISIKVNNKDAQKQITQIEKEIDSLQKKITGRQLKLDITNNALDKIRNDTNQSVIKEMPDAGNKRITQETYKRLDSNTNYQSLVKQSDKLNSEIEKYNALLNSAKSKMVELGQRTSKTSTTQNKLSSFFGAFKQKVEQTKPGIASMKDSFNSMPKITQNITNNIKGMGTKLKSGLGHILKYAGALFSMQSIYSTLSSCASTWLSSQNAGAKQLSANIEYMKYAMGSALAPVIQFVTNLVYQLMKAIQSVAYALTGVNIFAKASAKSYSAMAGSAKKAKQETKQLAGVHDEINNVQSNNNSDNGSGGSSAPSFDLSKFDNNMQFLIDKIKKQLKELFKPIQYAWNKYGQSLIESMKYAFNSSLQLIKKIGKSFKEVWLNGTGEYTVSIILQLLTSIFNTIGNISKAFKEAWENSKGIQIIQNLWNALNNVLYVILEAQKAIEQWTASQNFQNFANSIISILGTLSYWIELITQWIKGIWENGAKDVFTKILDCISKLIVAIDEILKFLSPVVEYIVNNTIPIMAEMCKAISSVIDALSGVLDFIIGVFQGDWEKAWNGIKEFFIGIWNAINIYTETKTKTIRDIVVVVFTDIRNFISNVWQQVTNKTSEAWQNIKNKVKEGAQGAWNGITSIFSNIPNWFRDKFSQAWQAVKNVFSTGGRIFDGIKEGILSGLKSIVNAIISGINKVISIPFNGLNSALRTIKNADIMGMRPFAWISTVQIPQIPRLAKGGVLYDETLVMAGEYSGAKTNPEIVTPQNIMYDTMRRALLDADIGNDNDTPINLTINVGNTKLGQILLDNLRDIKRQSGKDLEALVGG